MLFYGGGSPFTNHSPGDAGMKSKRTPRGSRKYSLWGGSEPGSLILPKPRSRNSRIVSFIEYAGLQRGVGENGYFQGKSPLASGQFERRIADIPGTAGCRYPATQGLFSTGW